MSEPSASGVENTKQYRHFSRYLLRDLRALEHMLSEGLIESGTSRIGAEQELFLVDNGWQPAPVAMEVLEQIEDPRVTTELTRFNLELNLPPLRFTGGCLREMEETLKSLLATVRGPVNQAGAELLMIGILPTIRLSDLRLENMTPLERYHLLNKRLTRLRGGLYEFQIRGIDELLIKHDSVMLEGCNTSFQVHLQVNPGDFAQYYNIAQAIAAPVLAAATNSPLLFGKRLWRETRIALFQQAVDTRSSNLYMRELSPRVNFGRDWLKGSVLEIFKEDIARFQAVITEKNVEDPFERLEQGKIPRLQALQVHNGTVYRWNRACYGVYKGKPHLRIENRVLPSGPTPIDEIANSALWLGLMHGMANRYGDITEHMAFDDAKANFMAAARFGLGSQFTWTDGQRLPADELILEELLPIAREGLAAAQINSSDIDRYLDVIQARTASGKTGSQWLFSSLQALEAERTLAERLNALTAAVHHRQQEGRPVHEWPPATIDEAGGHMRNFLQVEQCMTTDLFTVNENEPVEFVAHLMDWRRIRYVPVEDNEHQLVGIVSHRMLLQYLAQENNDQRLTAGPSVGELMNRKPLTVGPDTSTLEAIRLMQEEGVGALPVVQEGQLVGIVTENDFLQIAHDLMENLRTRQEP